MTFELW